MFNFQVNSLNNSESAVMKYCFDFCCHLSCCDLLIFYIISMKFYQPSFFLHSAHGPCCPCDPSWSPVTTVQVFRCEAKVLTTVLTVFQFCSCSFYQFLFLFYFYFSKEWLSLAPSPLVGGRHRQKLQQYL